MEIQWKPIGGLNYIHYAVSNKGDIKNLDSGLELKTHRNNVTGYEEVRLTIGRGKGKSFRVHRLVAEAFIPNPNHYPEVNHKNEVRTDNRVENLEWCTRQYNNSYGNHNYRVSEQQKKNNPKRIPIIVTEPDGTEIECKSLREAQRYTGVSRGVISVRVNNPDTHFEQDVYHFRYATDKKLHNKSIKKLDAGNYRSSKYLTYEEIVNRIHRSHPKLEIIKLGNKVHDKSRFLCKVCGNEFYMPAHDIFRGAGCPYCVRKRTGNLLTYDQEKAQYLLNKYLYHNLTIIDGYTKFSEPCTLKCHRCGKSFEGTPVMLISNAKKHDYISNGCQSCSKSRSMTIKNLLNYNYSREDIIKALHDKNLDWTLKDI